MATAAKKPKLNKKAKNFFAKHGQKKNFLKIGDQGFLVTYNFKEKESVREIYKLLNEYYQQKQQQQQPDKSESNNNKKEEESSKDEGDDDDDDDEEEEEDISKQLSAEIDKTKQENQEKSNLFQAVETGTNNCVFIKTSIEHYHELGATIIRDLFSTRVKRTRFSNRLIPVDRVCRANIDEITDAAGELFDLHFLKEPSTFAINFNRRCNNDVQRDDVIKQLAALVTQKNVRNKVDLKNPQKTILVEVIKGLALICVITDYLKLKKYNLNELWAKEQAGNGNSSQESSQNSAPTAVIDNAEGEEEEDGGEEESSSKVESSVKSD